MRRRILTVALSAVVLAVVLLGVPLGFAIQRNAVNEARGELERDALRAAVAVSPSYRSGDPVELPSGGTKVLVGLYAVDGHRVTGAGPTVLEPSLRAATTGRVTDTTTTRDLVAAVPVSVGENVIGIVRSSSTRASVRATVVRELLALGGAILLALAAAAVLAFLQARKVTGAMQDLATSATKLGAGDFAVDHPRSGVPEIDRTSEALAATARRIDEQMRRERAFASRASHQLRTPLTRLQLELEAGLEAGPAELERAVRDALGTADHLSRTIDDVLALARSPHDHVAQFEVEELVAECVADWHGAFAAEDRPLRLVVEDRAVAAGSRTAVRQLLQVLIDNAYRHGRGVVTLTARVRGDAVAIDVADQGTAQIDWPVLDDGSGHLGLAMARSIAESQQGRLLLATGEPTTRFTVLLPVFAE